MCVNCVCVYCQWMSEEDIGSPRTVVSGGCETCWCLEPNPGPMQEQMLFIDCHLSISPPLKFK